MADAIDGKDHLDIIRTVNSYFRFLDERRFEAPLFATIFTERGEARRPNGEVLTGPDHIAASHAKSMARFKVTQHLVSGHDVEIHGGSATVRANLVAIHLWEEEGNAANMLGNHFAAGGVLHVTLEKREEGWKMATVATHVVWRDGKNPQRMFETGKS
jgi:SnoaL-like domain